MTKEEFNVILKECAESKDPRVVADGLRDVLESKNPFFICDFAEYVPLADSETFMGFIEYYFLRECPDIYHAYEFTFCMATSEKRYFNLPEFIDYFCDYQNANGKILYYLLECLQGIPGFDSAQVEEALLYRTCDKKYIKLYLENENIEKSYTNEQIEERLAEIQSLIGNETILYENLFNYFLPDDEISLQEFLQNPNANNILLDDCIGHSKHFGDPYFVTLCAEYTECDKQKAFEFVKNSNNPLHQYEYYCAVPNLTKEERKILLNKIARSKYAKIMYYCIEWPEGDRALTKDESLIMLTAIEDTENEKYIALAKESVARRFGITF